ncbi:MAG: MoxR family ATPase [Planctomycetota bacterium]|nr:MoxR family ATPase [Planctomycetota bacterium]
MDSNASSAADLAQRVEAEARRVVVGLEREVEICLVALLAGGHVLLEGPPGVAKTLLVRTLATALGGRFGRIQFTPDLMPADVTGTSIFHPGEGAFRFQPGPVFAHVLLCDEINRAPAKTQSALLEAMQEAAVTSDGHRHALPRPFTVFATQNPIEHEGTYPLPEAQLDRFLFKVVVGYPEPDVEARLLTTSHARDELATPAELGVTAVSTPEDLLRLRAAVREVTVREDLPAYVVRLLAATRKPGVIVLGASPRAGVMLLRAAKARAAIQGRDFVLPDDVKSVFLPALRHRVMLDPAEEIEGTTSDDALQRILDAVEVPR